MSQKEIDRAVENAWPELEAAIAQRNAPLVWYVAEAQVVLPEARRVITRQRDRIANLEGLLHDILRLWKQEGTLPAKLEAAWNEVREARGRDGL